MYIPDEEKNDEGVFFSMGTLVTWNWDFLGQGKGILKGMETLRMVYGVNGNNISLKLDIYTFQELLCLLSSYLPRSLRHLTRYMYSYFYFMHDWV